MNHPELIPLPVRQMTGDANTRQMGGADIDAVLSARGKRYGGFGEHARITQDIKKAMASGRSWAAMSPSQKEALEMVAHKIGRIVNGDPHYADSWTDLIGYARLVQQQLTAGQEAQA